MVTIFVVLCEKKKIKTLKIQFKIYNLKLQNELKSQPAQYMRDIASRYVKWKKIEITPLHGIYS